MVVQAGYLFGGPKSSVNLLIYSQLIVIKTRVFCKTSPQTFETRNNIFLEETSTPVRVSENFRMTTAALQFRCTNIFCGLEFSAKSPNSPTFVTLQKYPFKRT